MTICHRGTTVPSTRPFPTTGSIPSPCKRVADGSPPVPLPVPPSPAPGRTSGTCRHRTTSVLLTDARARASAYCQVSALATRRTSPQPVGCPPWQHFGSSKVETRAGLSLALSAFWAHPWATLGHERAITDRERGSSTASHERTQRTQCRLAGATTATFQAGHASSILVTRSTALLLISSLSVRPNYSNTQATLLGAVRVVDPTTSSGGATGPPIFGGELMSCSPWSTRPTRAIEPNRRRPAGDRRERPQ